MINAAIKKWTQNGESRDNKCIAPNNGQSWRERNGKSLSIPYVALREREKKTSCFTKSSDLAYRTHTSPVLSKQKGTDCFKYALRNDYRGTPTKGLIVHCRWHISQGAFIAAWPLKSESCWVRGRTGPHLHNWGGNTCAPCGLNKEGRSS